MTELRLDGVACRRGGRVLFENVSVRLAAGDAARVTGPNGAGKSSLLRIAAGLLRPAAGHVVRNGRAGLLDERPALDERLPLGAALGFWARLDAGRAALERVGLAGRDPVPVRMLSTGQRKRAALARLLASDAAIWLLDEPEAGLDADGVGLLAGEMARHRQAGGVVLLATHAAPTLQDAVSVELGR